MRKFAFGVATIISMASAVVAQAQVTQTVGAGSAVSVVHASASFESQNALFDNPYLEGGLSFSRTNLSFDNNTCGFAGCAGHAGFAGFQGNYMYGAGTGGYFTMKAAAGQYFSGLEFLLGNGYQNTAQWNAQWTAFRNGSQVGTGTLSLYAAGDILGLSSATGFDELQYTDLDGYAAPAFDEVRAQYASESVVPEPGTWMLMASGLLVLGGAVRRKRQSV